MRWLKEPLVHFFLIGVVLFGVYLAGSGSPSDSERDIRLTESLLLSLEAQFERVWQRPPTPEEARQLVEKWVREEVLYREGMKMGLADSDQIIRRRIGQKIMFLAESRIPDDPGDEVLKAWLADHHERYRTDAVYDFQQILLNVEVGRKPDSSRARAALATVSQGGAFKGKDSMLPGSMQNASSYAIARTFGEAFENTLKETDVGAWTGPVKSGYGWHLVKLERSQPGVLPDFETTRPQVLRDWSSAQSEQAKEDFYRELRDQYEVALPASATGEDS